LGVEDDLELSSVIDRILISIDSTLSLEWATTAEEAIANLAKRSKEDQNKPFDLIVCDIFLEGAKNGLDLWKFCHNNYPQMKVVVISGIDLKKLTDLLGSYDAPAFFLSKPFTVIECSNLLEKLLMAT
jgi:CheY-like chemotaxis protein